MTKPLPPGWVETTIGEILMPQEDGRSIHQGWSPKCLREPSRSDNEWGVLKTTAIQSGEFLPEHNKALPPDLEPRPVLEVQDGDVLITCAGPRLRCGVACLVSNTRPRLLISGKMYRIRFDPVFVHPKFICAYLLSSEAWSAINEMKTGVSDSGLNLTQDRFRKLRVPLAPIDEQARIVAAIEEHLSRLDAVDSVLDEAEKRCQALVKSVLLSVIPSELPSDWQLSTVADAGATGLGRQRSPKYHSGPNMKPYLRVANVFEDRIDTSDVMEMHFEEDDFEKFRLRPGDVLLNEGQSPEWLGRPATYKGDPPEVAFTNSLIRFIPGDEVTSEWALLVFRRHMHAGRFMKESRITTNIAHLALGRFRTVEFPIPPREVQNELVASTRETLDAVDWQASQIKRARAKSQVMRQSVLSAAFSSQLVPQDPNDEPARALLERVRASQSPSGSLA